MNCNGNKNVYLTDITQITNFLAYVTIKHFSDFKNFPSLTTRTCHCLIANTDKTMLYKVQNLSPPRIPNEQWPTLWGWVNVTKTKSNKTASIYIQLRSWNHLLECVLASSTVTIWRSNLHIKTNNTFRETLKGLEFSYVSERLEPMVTPDLSERICYKYLSFNTSFNTKKLHYVSWSEAALLISKHLTSGNHGFINHLNLSPPCVIP
jgi:hypothetical protein